MPSDNQEQEDDDLRPEYEEELLKQLLKNGVRGKYVERYQAGTNVVKLAPDVAAAFPTEQAVNDALRALLSGAGSSRSRRGPA